MSSQPPAETVPAQLRGRSGGLFVITSWLVTRALMVLLALTVENVATGDVNYYWRKIDALFTVGLPLTMNEYPTPVVWMLALPYGLGAGTRIGYQIAFIGLMLALDALFCWLLWRSAGRRRDRAVDFWLLFIFLIGPLTFLRFDLIPAVLAGVSLLVIRRRPWLTGVLTGVGAAIKLWPALLIASFTAAREGRRQALFGFVAAGFGLALISLIAGGPARLFSPLTWQSDRGLQIESIWSTPLMLMRLIRPDTWVVVLSRYQAFEVFGPSVEVWLVVSTIATVLGFVIMIALYVRGWRNPQPSQTAVGLVVLATIAIMTVTNKTLSPQYLLWLAGPMAVQLLIQPRREDGRPTVISRFAVQLLVLALLTHLVYPLTYHGLYDDRYGALLIVSTILLTLRNLALLIFTVALIAAAWRAIGRRVDSDAPVGPPQ